jgi:acyl dehydratase
MLTRKTRRAKREVSPVAAGERLTFRAEVMPGRDAGERTYEVKRLLPNGRIELANLEGQHSRAEFEAVTKLENSRAETGLNLRRAE